MNGGVRVPSIGIKRQVFGRFCRRSPLLGTVGGFCNVQTFAAGELNDRL